ncbi:MAG TPA: FkbM family methyltransferase [Candidatus Paceibacterota bacterium]
MTNLILNKIKNFVPAVVKRVIKEIFFTDQSEKKDFNKCYSYPEEWLSAQPIFFGQYGEDLKILPLFFGKKDGYFVEIGAMDGLCFSNTIFFEKMGWKGVCIEPHPDYTHLLIKNRPGSIAIAAAVGREDKGAVDFYTNYRGSLSTLDKELEGYFRSSYGKWFGGFKKIQVPLVSLNTVLAKHNIPPGFEILSIDTEGTEADVLAGFDIKKYSPRVIIAEISIKKEPVEDYMKKHGYILACSNPSNAIFCKNEQDAEIIRHTNVIGHQDVTKHPLD